MAEYIYRADSIGEGQFQHTLVGELVRCGECKHREIYTPSWSYCLHLDRTVTNLFFCADGERRVDDV